MALDFNKVPGLESVGKIEQLTEKKGLPGPVTMVDPFDLERARKNFTVSLNGIVFSLTEGLLMGDPISPGFLGTQAPLR